MKQLTRYGSLAVATFAALSAFAFPASADEPTGRTHNCVNAPEWNGMDGLSPSDYGARRAVLEDAWNASPVGGPNDYYQPTNTRRWYSLAYRACGADRYMKIVVLYRVTSDTWQYSMKGEFVPGA